MGTQNRKLCPIPKYDSNISGKQMMIQEFKRGMDKLETVFRPLTGEQRDVYWDRLRLLAPDTFYRSIDYVIDIHKGKMFPQVAEILEATGHIATFSPGMPDYSGVKCAECQDIGYRMTDHKDHQPSVRPCGCELGKKIKQGWISHFKKGKK